MIDSNEILPIFRISREGKQDTEDLVTREIPLTVILNSKDLVTLLCSPIDLKYLAIGFLSSEGLINSKDEVRKVMVNDQRGEVRVETKGYRESLKLFPGKRLVTSGGGRGAYFRHPANVEKRGKVESRFRISADQILALVKQFQHQSQIYRTTGGVHSAALCDERSILVFSEDIGRHNAIDKIFGKCVLEGISMDNRIIITSGRISSEIVLKVTKREIPILVSKSAPTNLGVKLASNLGITLLGFVREDRMNVYTGRWRIISDGE